MNLASGDSNLHNEPNAPSEFELLIARIRAGDESASAELVQRYERPIIRAVRARLGNRLRRVFDSMDVLQSVNRSLFVGLRSQKFQFSQPAQLIALAVLLVQRKVARHWRNVRESLPVELKDGMRESPLLDIESHEPEQSSVVAAEELLQRFLSYLDELDKQLVQLKLEGHSSVEVAAVLKLAPAFVRMRWSRLRDKLRAAVPIESGSGPKQ